MTASVPEQSELSAAALLAGLPAEQGRIVAAAIAVGDELETPVYLIGGVPRDLLLGRPARDLDFVGSAQCGSHSSVKGTAVFLGPGLTDLPVRQVPHSGVGRMAFPLIATY